MDGFDTITMSYLAAPMSLQNAAPPDPLQPPMMPMDTFDQRSNYDADTFAA